MRSTVRQPRPAWDETPALQDFYNQTYRHRSRVLADQAFDVVVGDSLYFGSSNSDKVTCLNALSGSERWEYFTGGPVRFAPSVAPVRTSVMVENGMAYWGAGMFDALGRHLCGRNASDGTGGWKITPARPTQGYLLSDGWFTGGRINDKVPVNLVAITHHPSLRTVGLRLCVPSWERDPTKNIPNQSTLGNRR